MTREKNPRLELQFFAIGQKILTYILVAKKAMSDLDFLIITQQLRALLIAKSARKGR